MTASLVLALAFQILRLRPAIFLIKKILHHICFHENFGTFSRIAILQNTSEGIKYFGDGIKRINLFQPNAPFLYPLKTSYENGIFHWYVVSPTCGIYDIAFRKSFSLSLLISTPSILRVPLVGPSLNSIDIIELLPAPVRPTIPIYEKANKCISK